MAKKALKISLFSKKNAKEHWRIPKEVVEEYSQIFESGKEVCEHVEFCLDNCEFAKLCKENSKKQLESTNDGSFFNVIFSGTTNRIKEFGNFGLKCSTKILKNCDSEEK